MNLVKKSLCEFLGTAFLVFFGTGSFVVNEVYGGFIGNTGIAIAFGLVVMAMILVFGSISGAHINPAVTLVLWLVLRFPVNQLFAYIVAQFAGAVAASLLLFLLFPDSSTLGATIPSGEVWVSFVLEVILGFILMLVIIIFVTGISRKPALAGITIGGVVLLEALFAGPITGASMNPARSLAPAFVSGNTEFIWLYVLAPLTGMLLAVLACILTRETG